MKPPSEVCSLRPGGAPWLMRHELRLFVADSATAVGRALQRAPERRALPVAILGWLATVYLVLHVVAWSALPSLPYWRPTESIGQLHLDGAAAAVLFILMLSAAMIRCVHVMYARNDLDLLLCAPVPGVTLLRARLGGVVLGTLLLVLFLVSPIIHIGLLTGRPRLLALYPALLAMATIAASCGMMITIELARLIGPRRTAIVAQVPGTVVVVGLYLMPKLQDTIPAGIETTLGKLLEDGAMLGPSSPLWLPVLALQGSPLALMLFCFVLPRSGWHMLPPCCSSTASCTPCSGDAVRRAEGPASGSGSACASATARASCCCAKSGCLFCASPCCGAN